MRKNKEENTKFPKYLQDLDPKGFPHKEGILIGEDVDLDLLYLSLKGIQDSLEGEGDSKLNQGQQWGAKQDRSDGEPLGKKAP